MYIYVCVCIIPEKHEKQKVDDMMTALDDDNITFALNDKWQK